MTRPRGCSLGVNEHDQHTLSRSGLQGNFRLQTTPLTCRLPSTVESTEDLVGSETGPIGFSNVTWD